MNKSKKLYDFITEKEEGNLKESLDQSEAEAKEFKVEITTERRMILKLSQEIDFLR